VKRPWNIPSLPVYSLATYGEKGVNMNICTYVSAVSMQPKLYAIAVYENTQTLHNLKFSTSAILQLLSPDQYTLVNHLGKKSGKNFDKHEWLMQKKRVTCWNGYTVLSNCSAYIELHYLDNRLTGDHHLYTFEVKRYSALQTNVLTTQFLSEKKIIRI
jgi:flavin reductase (DIM6/NTAB) family NADH-FMN oxidoreductase RutF